MRIKALLAVKAGEPFMIEAADLEEPRDGEILVNIGAAGISHIDLLGRDGDLSVPLPAVFGREAAGTVERIGAAVTGFAPGDHVVLTFHTGELGYGMAEGGLVYGSDVFDLNFSGFRPDGSSPLKWKGQKVAGAFFGQSSFATHALVPARNAVRVEKDLPFELLAPFGGDFQTGAGAVINTLRPRPGCAIAVFGAGVIGLSAIMAADLAGCHPIIAVDIKASRLELAEALGAAVIIDPDGLEAVDAIREITKGGAEFSVDTTGLTGSMRQAADCLAPGGICALAGMGKRVAGASFNLRSLLEGRTVRGSLFGGGVPALFIPSLLDSHRRGRFPADRIIQQYRFEDINKAADDAISGAAVKAVLTMA